MNKANKSAYSAEGYRPKIKKLISLENIRMLYGFMYELEYQIEFSENGKSLDEVFLYDGKGGLKERVKRMKSLEHDFEVESLKRSEYKRYIEFWHGYFGIDLLKGDDSCRKTLMRMFRYYYIAHHLQADRDINIKHETLPYRYEDICLTIAELTGYDMCYILYKNGDTGDLQTVSQSGFLYDEDKLKYIVEDDKRSKPDSEAQNDWFKKMISEVDEHYGCDGNADGALKALEIVDSVFAYDHSLCFRLPFEYGKVEARAQERRFYIVLIRIPKKDGEEYKDEDEKHKMLTAARVLFMRDTMSEILCRNYAVLLNFRYNCEYIQSMASEFKPKKDFPKILHISDLHIKKDEELWCSRDDIISKDQNPIDLLAVTGDIVQGSKEALIAQNYYKAAEEHITRWAIRLWGVEEESDDDHPTSNGELTDSKGEESKTKRGRLPHDWRRRIMITTGNHDYMTMNELATSSENRETKFGQPAKNSGGTMVKFTYYIEMLQQWLDAPTVRLIKNDLNEYRYYKHLNLKVLILNSVSGANALQNNKVRIDEDIAVNLAKTIFKEENGKNDRAYKLCLLHHPPNYDIDYVSDAYGWHNYFSGNKTREVLGRYKADLEKTANSDLCESAKEQKKQELEKEIDALNKLLDKIDCLRKCMVEVFLRCIKIHGSFDKIDCVETSLTSKDCNDFVESFHRLNEKSKELQRFGEDGTSDLDFSKKEEVKALIREEDGKFKSSLLYSDLKTICDELKRFSLQKNHFSNNDSFHKTINRIRQWSATEAEDKKYFDNVIDKIIKESNAQDNKILFLAGHVHNCGENRELEKPYPEDKPTFVVGKEQHCFSIIEEKDLRCVIYRSNDAEKGRYYLEEEKKNLEDQAQYNKIKNDIFEK